MSTAEDQAHAQLVQEVADSYKQKGFCVEIEPSNDKLPDFLKEFQPDMIVTSLQNTHIYVEVRRKGQARGRDYWQRLKDTIASDPNWQLQIAVRSLREQELFESFLPLLTNQEVEERLNAGQRLAQDSLLDSALLVTWSGLEAVLRRIGQNRKIRFPDQTPETLLTQLVYEGRLDRDDYDALVDILPSRNQAAHGHAARDLTVSTFEQAQKIARRLLKQQQRHAA